MVTKTILPSSLQLGYNSSFFFDLESELILVMFVLLLTGLAGQVDC